MQRLHACGDDDLAAVQPPRKHHRPGIKAQDLNRLEGNGQAVWINHPNCRTFFLGGQCTRWERNSATVIDFHPARHGRTKPHGRGWIIDRYADLKRACDWISLRIDLPHSSLCSDIW